MAENEFYKRWPHLLETTLDFHHDLDLSPLSDEALWTLFQYVRKMQKLVDQVAFTSPYTNSQVVTRVYRTSQLVCDTLKWNKQADEMLGGRWREKLSEPPTRLESERWRVEDADEWPGNPVLTGNQQTALYNAWRGKQ